MVHHNTAVFATVGVIGTIAIIAGAMIGSTYLSTPTTSVTQSISTQSVTNSFTSTISSGTHGWINSSEGMAEHLMPVTFGADYNGDISPLGPSVALGTLSSPGGVWATTEVQGSTLVAESFRIVATTIFSTVEISFSAPANGPNVTMAVYINGGLLSSSTKSLNLGGSIPSNQPVSLAVDQTTYMYLNKTYTVSTGTIVTLAFLADGPVSVYPIGGIGGSSSLVYNTSSIPSTWTGAPSGSENGPIFLGVGLANSQNAS